MKNIARALCILPFSFSCYQEILRDNSGCFPGNRIVEFVADGIYGHFRDPVDDTINYKRVSDEFFRDRNGKIYMVSHVVHDYVKGMTTIEYYNDMTDFIDLKIYSRIGDLFFRNRDKVYMWWMNSGGYYVIKLPGSDANTFIPFDGVAGGKDKNYVFYGGVPHDFDIIPDADPATIRILNPARGCWNCGNCYFVDKNSVYFGLQRIEGADPTSFRLVNQDSVDAEDNFGTSTPRTPQPLNPSDLSDLTGYIHHHLISTVLMPDAPLKVGKYIKVALAGLTV